MPCIGNDIVDLTAPENQGKSRDRRFLDRVFTPDEQDIIRQTTRSADAVLWAIWAAKEGVYKALSKDNPGLVSIPRRYSVEFLDRNLEIDPDGNDHSEWTGVVHTPIAEVSFRTVFAPQYVHCLAMTGGSLLGDAIIYEVVGLDDGESASVSLRRTAIKSLAMLLDTPLQKIELRRPRTPAGYGPPYVLVGGSRADVDISLSHDGGYGAFAIYTR